MKFKQKDRTGVRYGRLVALKVTKKDTNGRYLWLCRCDCGVEKEIIGSQLGKGVYSCGCMAIELRRNRATTHGLSKSKIYEIWSGMIQRCEYKQSDSYKLYGGRGIKICNEWRNDFKTFYDWAIANGYKSGLTIDRFPDKLGDYKPGNCRWATVKQQGWNLTTNRIITHNGISKCVAEWANDLNISSRTLFTRIYRGWTDEQCILGTPPKRTAAFFSKKVKDKKTGKVYKSVKEASDNVGIAYSTLSKMLQGRIKNKTSLIFK